MNGVVIVHEEDVSGRHASTSKESHVGVEKSPRVTVVSRLVVRKTGEGEERDRDGRGIER